MEKNQIFIDFDKTNYKNMSLESIQVSAKIGF